MSFLAELATKNILVMGLGKTGMSCARFLTAQGISFSVNDSRENLNDAQQLTKAHPHLIISTGAWDKQLIAAADVIIISPGVDLQLPELVESKSEHCLVIGDVELFARISDIPVIAVTGSNGKSTVVSLVAHLGNACGVKAIIGGNFGVPVLDLIEQDIDCLVLELSSFQIESLSSLKALAGTVLNICDDHLDRHHTLENYRNIKLALFNQCEVAVINRDDKQLVNEQTEQAAVSFGADQPLDDNFGLAGQGVDLILVKGTQHLVKAIDLPLAGKHNVLNVLAALALGEAAGWPIETMCDALESFEGLAHRCQRIASNDDVFWVNDSKATNIGATVAAIEGLANNAQQLILIAGGDGKGANFNELESSLNAKVDKLITLGRDGDKIAALKEGSIQVASIEQAVSTAKQIANSGDIVLLSPACASLDMFKNFEQRGEAFINAVREVS